MSSLFSSINLCLFLCQYYNVFSTVALKYSLKSGNVILPFLFFFLKILFLLLGIFCISYKFRIIYSNYAKKPLDIALNL